MKSIIAALALVVVVAPAGARAAIPGVSEVGPLVMTDVPGDVGDGICTMTGYYDGRLQRMVSYEEATESVAMASAPNAEALPATSARLDEDGICTESGYFDGEHFVSVASYHHYAPRPTLASGIPELAAFLATPPEEALAGDAAPLMAAVPRELPVSLSLIPAELASMMGEPVTPPLLPTLALADTSAGSDLEAGATQGDGEDAVDRQPDPETAFFASAETRSLTRPTCGAQLASNVSDTANVERGS